MLTAVKEIGDLILNKNARSNLETYIEIISADQYPYTFCVVIDQEKEIFKYIGVELEQTNAGRGDKYLYKKGSSRGSNYSPTALITELNKTLNIKFLGWFNAVEKNEEISESNKEKFKKIKYLLNENEEKIITEALEKDLPSKEKKVITLKVGERYLYEIPEFVDAFEKMLQCKKSAGGQVYGQCSICGENKLVQSGTNVYAFYTIDNPGFIKGGFNQDLSWRNYPVCGDCDKALVEGRRFIEKYLSFRFYGLSYTLIPQFIFKNQNAINILEILKDQANKNVQLNKDVGSNLTTYEDDILEELKEQKDFLSLNFLFLKKQNSAERILLLIKDVFPSRLRMLFKAKEYVDNRFIEKQIRFHLGRIRTFFSKSDKNKVDSDLEKYFLQIVNSIFKDKPLLFNFIVTNYMREIRSEFNNPEGNYYFKVIDAIQSTMFLNYLELIGGGEDRTMESKFDEVLKKYNLQMDTNEKKGIFLLGALTKMLLNIQQVKREAQPFIMQLKGLKMKERDIKGLLPKVENKLQEYRSFGAGKAVLSEEITRLLLSSESKWKLSVDELNFYFVCGMNLYKEIKEALENLYGEKEEEDNVIE